MKYLYFTLILLFFVTNNVLSDVQVVNNVATAKVNLFNKIASCESGNDPHAKSRTSSASGRFQFLWGTWNHYGKELWGGEFYQKNVWDYNDNTELAWYVYTKYGTSDWNESKSCWSKPQ